MLLFLLQPRGRRDIVSCVRYAYTLSLHNEDPNGMQFVQREGMHLDFWYVRTYRLRVVVADEQPKSIISEVRVEAAGKPVIPDSIAITGGKKGRHSSESTQIITTKSPKVKQIWYHKALLPSTTLNGTCRCCGLCTLHWVQFSVT